MEIKGTIRVILADDHPMVRRGIRRILEKGTDIYVIGEAATGAAALRLVYELEPDVLLLDIEMPDMKGDQVARELRKSNVPVAILVLSTCDDDHFIEEILRVGVDGYLSNNRRRSVVHAQFMLATMLMLTGPVLDRSLYFIASVAMPELRFPFDWVAFILADFVFVALLVLNLRRGESWQPAAACLACFLAGQSIYRFGLDSRAWQSTVGLFF